MIIHISKLNSESNGLDSSPDQGHSNLFLSESLFCQLGTGEDNAGVALKWTCILSRGEWKYS